MPLLTIEKMAKICTGFFLVLSLFYGCSANTYKQDDTVNVDCGPKESGTLTFWFRIKGNVADFLSTVKNNDKLSIDNKNIEVTPGRLTIKSFKKETHSGLYTCANMNKNHLFFGQVTNVQGEPDPTTPAPKRDLITTKPVEVTTTTKPCICKKDPKPVLMCEMWILSSLAGGCALLLILLIFTILYCNRLRTRRCPHHYKRKPQSRPTGHAKLPNTHF